MHSLQYPHDVDSDILFWPWPPFNPFQRSCLTWIFIINLLWWVSLYAQFPTKAMTFQQIIMHVLQCPHDVDVHLLLCFNLFPMSCLTYIFIIYLLWWVPHCVQCPTKAMIFQQIIMHVFQCPHDVDVYVFSWSWWTWIFFIILHLRGTT